jgi:valyl-tRNA synthetase
VKLISDIRSARSELNVPAGAKLKLLVSVPTTTDRSASRRTARDRAAGRGRGHRGRQLLRPKAALQIVVGEATYALPSARSSTSRPRARAEKEIKKLADEIAKIDAKLGNAAFVSRAPEEVVEEQRERRQQAEETRARLSTALQRLLA